MSERTALASGRSTAKSTCQAGRAIALERTRIQLCTARSSVRTPNEVSGTATARDPSYEGHYCHVCRLSTLHGSTSVVVVGVLS